MLKINRLIRGREAAISATLRSKERLSIVESRVEYLAERRDQRLNDSARVITVLREVRHRVASEHWRD